jgi:site-specific recombinase XerD
MPASTAKKELPFFELYQKFIRDSKTGRRLQPGGKKISSGTIDNYLNSLKVLEAFCTKKQFHLRLRPVHRLNKRELVTEKNYWKRFYKQFTDYLYHDCGYYDNYAGHVIKNLRCFFNYLNKDLLLTTGDFHKQFYVRKEEIPIYPLTPEELNFLIYNKTFEESLSPRMKEVKDFFVFGCTVALRVSDLLKLSPVHLRYAGAAVYLLVRSQKTATDTQVRLPEYAVAILDKYKRKRKKLLPHFNKVNLNKYIKLLLEQAGFTHTVQKTREKRGRAVELKKQLAEKKQEFRFCDVATSHTMRRTAITTMLSLGMPEQVVRKISGHAPGSKEFYRYVSWAQSYQDMETDKMFAVLAGKTSLMPVQQQAVA